MNNVKEAILNLVRPYIPKEIVMTPKAYSVPMNQEKTIINFMAKIKEQFCQNYPQYANSWSEIEHDVEYSLSKHILVGPSNPNDNCFK